MLSEEVKGSCGSYEAMQQSPVLESPLILK